MSGAYDDFVRGVCEAFDLSPYVLRTSPVLEGLVADALEGLGVEEVVARVLGRGSVAGARDPYAVLVTRVRWLVTGIDEEARLAAHAEREREANAEAQARKRAAVLAGLVATGELPLDAAEAEIAHVLREAPLLQEAALAELRRYVAAMPSGVRT